MPCGGIVEVWTDLQMDTAIVSTTPDYAGAIAHALQRLRLELPSQLIYHGNVHTEQDVIPAATRLGQLSGLAEHDLHLLEVAAAYHDIGQIAASVGHETVGVDIMSFALPEFGFGDEDIQRVAGMILATRLPQTPLNDEQRLMADADLDSLGREDFFVTSKMLWEERRACRIDIPWQQWLQNQLDFLRDHRYFTEVAERLRGEGKRRNIELLERLIRGECVPEIRFE